MFVGNEQWEDNQLTVDPIDRHQHQSQIFEETGFDTRTDQKQNIVDIEASSSIDSQGSAVNKASK